MDTYIEMVYICTVVGGIRSKKERGRTRRR